MEIKKIIPTEHEKDSEMHPSQSEQRDMLCEKLGFAAAESYKLLRTNLMFALPDEKKCRIIGVTSAVRGEGKSTTAINLSYTLAETEKKVLLIDADLRLPSVAKKLEIKGKPGLTNLLAGLCNAEEVIQTPKAKVNWWVMPAGDIPPNPSELLGSTQMQSTLQHLATEFDFIVVDLPPVNIVSDALVISNLIDGLIVAVRQGYSDRQSVNACMRQISVTKAKVLGFVMTDVKDKGKDYGRYKGRYRKSYKRYGYRYGYRHGRYGRYGYDYDYGYGYGNGRKPSGADEPEEKVKTTAKSESKTNKKEETKTTVTAK